MKRTRKGLMKVVKKWEKDWEGMPEFSQNDVTPFRSLIVHFKNQKDVGIFCKRVRQSITPKTKYIYFPKQKNLNLKKLKYVDGDDES